MNRNFALAVVLAAAAAGNAFADDITIDPTPFKSTATRAAVRADMMASWAAGLTPWSDEFNQLTAFRSSKSRAEVMAEFALTRAEVAAFQGEGSGSTSMARNVRPGSSTRMAAR